MADTKSHTLRRTPRGGRPAGSSAVRGGTHPAPDLALPMSLCQHTLIELHGCDGQRLKRTGDVRVVMVAAVRTGGGTIVKALFHNFSPYGVSGVVVITESHVTVHTWPEYGYAAVDVFSCSGTVDHRAIRKSIAAAFGARRVSSRTLRRGTFPGRGDRGSGIDARTVGRARTRSRQNP